MSMSSLWAAYGQLVNGTFSQQVLNNCTEACSKMSGVAPQLEAYCGSEAARADLAAKTDVCARGALLLATVPCGCAAIKEGVQAVTAGTWGQKAGHLAKSIGWATVGGCSAWLATTSPLFSGSVDQYGVACQNPRG